MNSPKAHRKYKSLNPTACLFSVLIVMKHLWSEIDSVLSYKHFKITIFFRQKYYCYTHMEATVFSTICSIITKMTRIFWRFHLFGTVQSYQNMSCQRSLKSYQLFSYVFIYLFISVKDKPLKNGLLRYKCSLIVLWIYSSSVNFSDI